MITNAPFTVAVLVGEDEPRPTQHAAMIGPGLLCPELRDLRKVHTLRWTTGVSGVNCWRCRDRLREVGPRG